MLGNLALSLNPVGVSQWVFVDIILEILNICLRVDFATGCDKFDDIKRRCEELILADSIFDNPLISAGHLDEFFACQEPRVLV